MPVLRRSQSTLEFPLQKNGRQRVQKLKDEAEQKSPRKRRSRRSEILSTEDCSSIKKVKTPVKVDSPKASNGTPTRSRRSILQKDASKSPAYASKENTPRARNKNRVSFAPQDIQVQTLPLSPRRNTDNVINNQENIIKSQTPTKSPLRPAAFVNQCSPSPIRALDFFSSSVTQRTPQKEPQRFTPTKRALNFSPGKEMRLGASPARRSICLPISREFKVPTSPARKSLGPDFSPLKEVRLAASPSKSMSQVALSPRKAIMSPRKMEMLSPRKAAMLSPRKSGLMSPRKLDQPPLSPRKLDVRSLNSPFRLAKQEGICYQRAKQALHTALPERIVCREKEANIVNGFLEKHISKKTPGSLYISGAPGTGKTAVLSSIIQDLHARKDCQTVYINCMNFKNSQAIFNKVQSEMQNKMVTMPTKQATKQLEQALCTKGQPVVLILDEVDQLDSRNQDVLYTMFEWPTLKNSRLVLIGIANALDLTDRILPRLQARPNCRPELLNFEPYTKDQIVSVLKDRLSQVSLEGHIVLDPAAIQFCARKVSAVAGDMRRALDVCRRAVEMVEADVRKQQVIHPISSLAGCNSPSKMPPVPKKITVAHVMKTLNEVYGSNVTSNTQSATIPLQQKLAVCSLLLLSKHGKGKEVTLGKLHETYQKVCSQQQVAAVSQSEFHSMCSLIEAKGILGMRKAKEARLAKVTLKLDENELQQALQDKVLLSAILQNGLPK